MKKFQKSSLFKGLIVIALLALPQLTKAQFEQKLTLNASGAGLVPDILSENSIFDIGMGLDGGIQFNANKHFSLMANARYYFAYGFQDYETNMDNIAFGVGLKLNMLPNRAINPYLFVEGNVNFIWGMGWYPYPEPIIDEFGIWENGFYSESYYTGVGGLGGLGFDINFGKNFGLFIQGGGYYLMPLSDEETESLNVYGQFGIRINLIKSKRI